MTDPLAWLNIVYALLSQSRTDAAIDVVLREFDVMLSNSRFADADSTLSALDPARLDAATMLAVLSVTARTPQLAERAEFLRGVEERLPSLVGHERSARLLEAMR